MRRKTLNLALVPAVFYCLAGISGLASTQMGSTAPKDRKALVAQLEAVPEIRQRWPGEKVFLDTEYGTAPAKAEFEQSFGEIAKRHDIQVPDVIVVKAPLDKNGRPMSQKVDAGIAWGVIGGSYHDVVFVTEYLKDNLNDAELLAVLAHEMAHVAQAAVVGHQARYLHGRQIESEADLFALSSPEVDPAAFRSMVIKVGQLTGTSAGPRLALFGDSGGDHPTISTRVKWAEEEMQRRSDSAGKPLL